MNPRGNPAAFGKLGGEAASVCQRVEDNAFHLRTLSERWIGFSEDDAKTNRRRRRIFCALPAKRCSISNLGDKAASTFSNALRTKRSTCQRWIGFSEDDAKINRQRRKNLLRHCGSPVRLIGMKIYRGFPARLYHRVPHRVEPGALFHIRIALNRQKEQKALLIDPPLAQGILD